MTADHLIGIEKFESELWKVADDLRANSGLASNEYFMPILGLLFLRHATNRFYEARAAIDADKAAGKMPDRPLIEADFTRRRALMLPDSALYDTLLGLPKDGKLGAALTAAMEAIEAAFPPLAGQLPKEYERFEDDLLERLIGSIRRECLDHAVVLGEAHLRRILKSYTDYYNSVRTRRSLHKDAPISRPIHQTGIIRSHPILGGLHHHYVRV